MNKPYQYYKALTDSDILSASKSAKKMQQYIENSEAVYHGIIVRSLYIPKIFTEDMVTLFKELTDTTYKILEKVIANYKSNSKYRQLFGFSKQLEELILRPDTYECALPIARIDIFFDEDDYSFKFCEFNADGASAMNEDRELNIALLKSSTYDKFKERYETKTFELFDSWVGEFLSIYKSTKDAKKSPNIAIVDFFPHDIGFEFKRFEKHFKDRGLNCEICPIDTLSYEGKNLISPSGMVIDAIYRRAVTCDIMENYDNVLPFINAVKDNNVILIGDFKTQIIHNKIIFKILHDDMTKEFLTDEENEFIKKHIPFTAVLNDRSVRENNVLKDKNSWVIKPQDSYASKGFYAGVEFDDDILWKEAVEKNIDNDYILQEYVKPYEILNIDLLHEDNPEYQNFSSITGLFVYNGKFSGIYSRIAKTSIISTQYSEMSLPSIVVKEK